MSFTSVISGMPWRRQRQRERHKTTGLMSENNASAHAFYILVHFFAVPCKTTTSNDQILGFVANMNTQRSIFLSLFKLESPPYEFSSWTVQLRQTNSTNWNNCKVVSKSTNSFFQKKKLKEKRAKAPYWSLVNARRRASYIACVGDSSRFSRT